MNGATPVSTPMSAPSLETIGMTKIFGPLVALDDVSIKVEPGEFHALLGENGAGKSTLVKCIMGFYAADKGQVLLDGAEAPIHNPRDARACGIGMVYQHFTLVPSLTGAENLVISRADAPAVIDWKKETQRLDEFLSRMPFRVPLDVQVSALAAGERQKLVTSRNLCVIMMTVISLRCAMPLSRPSISSASSGVSTEVGSSRMSSRWSR